MHKKVDLLVIGFYTGLIVFLLVQIFMTMYSMRIRIFDEAIYANNSLEILMSGNWLSYTVDLEPDLYNTKPPLVLWLQVISLRIFGVSALGVRMPTFLALLFLSYAVLLFSKKWLQVKVGLLAIIIIISTPGLIVPHVFLTGDLDAVLVLFSFLAFALVFKISLADKIRTCEIYLLGLVMLLGFFTKSTAILLILPSLLIVLVLYKKFLLLLKNHHTYVAIFCSLAVIVFYYLVKEYYQPGAWHQVWFSEVERLYNDVLPWHHHGYFFYFERIYDVLNPYYLFVTIGVGLHYFFIKGVQYKKCCSCLLIATAVYLLFVSLPDTKLDWYLAPIMPIWSLAIAIMLFEMSGQIVKRIGDTNYQTILKFTICLLVLVYPVYHIQGYIKESADYVNNEEKEIAFINELAPNEVPTNIHILSAYDQQGTDIITQPHNNDVILFYKKSLVADGKKINLIYQATDLQIGDTVIYGQDVQRENLAQLFKLLQIDSNQLGSMVVLKEKLNSSDN